MTDNLFDNLKKEVLEIIDRHPTLSPDDAFIAWFLRAFVVETEESAVKSLTGGKGDKSTDAVFIDHESRAVFVLQGKFHQGSKVPTEKRSDIIALADLGRSLISGNSERLKALLEKANETVKNAVNQALSVIHKRNYRLILQFVTTGKVSPDHKNEADVMVEEWQTASFETFSRADLLRLMQDYIEGAAPPTPTVTLPISGQEVFKRYDDATGITSWIFSMAGSDVGKLYEEIGMRLFARNIRGFLGNTDINRVMQATLKEEPEFFWYFNNGITIVCDEARQISKRGADHLRVTNAQIINGQQTTRCLALQKNAKAEVLAKLVEIPRDSSDAHSKYGHIVSEIVSATNWQNYITQSDLKANDVEQVRIEREFRKLNYQYLRKKIGKAEARRLYYGRYRWTIKKEEIARSVGACVLDPYEVRLGKDRLFEDDVYSKVFNGRSSTEYLTIYWLDRLVSYWGGRQDSRRSSARWLVLNFIWSHLSSSLRVLEIREKFRYLAERLKNYIDEIKPLDEIADTSFSDAMAFYRANKQRYGGKIQEESDFFKHTNLHFEFEAY